MRQPEVRAFGDLNWVKTDILGLFVFLDGAPVGDVVAADAHMGVVHFGSAKSRVGHVVILTMDPESRNLLGFFAECRR